MNFTCKKCGFYFNHTNLIDIDCPVCDGNHLKIENVMKKTDLINHIKNLLEIEQKEFEVEQYNYFSPEIIMWRNRFLKENNVFDKSITNGFLGVLSENLMKSSPEEILRIYNKTEEEE